MYKFKFVISFPVERKLQQMRITADIDILLAPKIH